MSVLIRPSRDEDVAGIAPIYAESVKTGTASWEYAPPSFGEFALRRQEVLTNGYPYLVADVGGVLAGYAYASSYRSRIGYRFTVEDSVYVAANLQGRGIGKTLLMALIAECKTRNFHAMIAVIGDSHNLASIRLHAACGFDVVGTFPEIGYKFDRWLDSVQMCRGL